MAVNYNYIVQDTFESIELIDKILDIRVPEDKHIILVSEDVTRPGYVVPHMVLDHMIECRGYRNVTLVVASGMHRSFSMRELSNKFGPNVSEIRVLFNNPQNNNDWLEDFKKKTNGFMISLSSTMPHMHVGMSGGDKVIVPGCAHWTTTNNFHKSKRDIAQTLMCDMATNLVDYYICYVIDSGLCCVDFYSGYYRYKLYNFMEEAKKYFKVKIPTELPDAIILAPLIKNFDFQQCMNVFNILRSGGCKKPLVRQGGIIGILANPVDGIGTHYLFQAVTGIAPVYYDEIYKEELRDGHLVIISHSLPEVAVQDFFKTKMMVVESQHSFEALVQSKFVNPTINYYVSPETMIGE
jgi:hypothetical protein